MYRPAGATNTITVLSSITQRLTPYRSAPSLRLDANTAVSADTTVVETAIKSDERGRQKDQCNSAFRMANRPGSASEVGTELRPDFAEKVVDRQDRYREQDRSNHERITAVTVAVHSGGDHEQHSERRRHERIEDATPIGSPKA